MERLEYKRLDMNEIVEKTKSFGKRMVGKIIEETNPKYMDDEDWILVKESMELFEECLESTKDYQEIINYQTKLLEQTYLDMQEMKRQLDTLIEEKA